MNLDTWSWLLPAIAALLGLLIGSFLNVCIYRLPRDLSVVRPRSFCPHCSVPIPWYRNVPILSFVSSRGRCANCSEAISPRYPTVEGITALLFALLMVHYGLSLSWLKWAMFESLLLLLFWTDMETRLLVDEGTWGGLGCGLLFSFFVPMPLFFGLLLFQGNTKVASFAEAGSSALFLSGTLWLARAVYQRLRGKEGLGLGDVKLVAMLGAFAGLQPSIAILAAAAVAGSVIGLSYIVVTRKDASAYQLPFGSFICAAGAVWPLLPEGWRS